MIFSKTYSCQCAGCTHQLILANMIVILSLTQALLLLLDHMEHPPSLSSLLSSSQLHQLILTTCRSHHHHGNKQDYLWSCRAVHNLFLHMLAFEKGTTEEKEIEEEAPDLDQEGDSITPGSDTPVEEPVPASDYTTSPSLVLNLYHLYFCPRLSKYHTAHSSLVLQQTRDYLPVSTSRLNSSYRL